MRDTIEKIVVVFLAIVFISVLVHHGAIDFSLWDKTVEVTKTAVDSEEGQALIEETKETSYDVAKTFVDYFSSSAKKARSEADRQGKVLIPVELSKVVDGDTLIVDMDGKSTYVRLIGIDTPESVNPDQEKNNEWGDLASDHTKSLLINTDTVYLQLDTEQYDKYGRLLAYVWITDEVDVSSKQSVANYMLNGIIIRDGYAMDKKFPPNIMYADVFEELRQDAADTKAGLWSDDEFAELWTASGYLPDFQGERC